MENTKNFTLVYLLTFFCCITLAANPSPEARLRQGCITSGVTGAVYSIICQPWYNFTRDNLSPTLQRIHDNKNTTVNNCNYYPPDTVTTTPPSTNDAITYAECLGITLGLIILGPSCRPTYYTYDDNTLLTELGQQLKANFQNTGCCNPAVKVTPPEQGTCNASLGQPPAGC